VRPAPKLGAGCLGTSSCVFLTKKLSLTCSSILKLYISANNRSLDCRIAGSVRSVPFRLLHGTPFMHFPGVFCQRTEPFLDHQTV